MKKLIALAAALVMGAFAFGEAYVSANDLDKGIITENKALEDGFEIIATAEKSMEITSQSSDCPNEVNGEVFTKRIKIGGAGKVDYRSVSFPAKAGQKVTVYAKSSSKTDARLVSILNEEGAEIGTTEAGIYADPISVGTVEIPADGKYFVTSKKSGIYVYSIIVE